MAIGKTGIHLVGIMGVRKANLFAWAPLEKCYSAGICNENVEQVLRNRLWVRSVSPQSGIMVPGPR